MTKNCVNCNAEFTTKFHTKKYCSRKCGLVISNEKYRTKGQSELLKRGFFCWSEYAGKTIIV